MAQATSFTSLNSVSRQELKPSEVDGLVKIISIFFIKAGMKKPEAEELIKSQASLWKFIEEKCSINQIDYGIANSYRNYKENPDRNPLTMKLILDQIQTGLFDRYFE